MKKSILLVFVFAISFQAFGQTQLLESEKPNNFEHHLGLSGVTITNWCGIPQLSYRLFYKRFGTDITFYPNFNEYRDTYEKTISSGVTFLYKLYQNKAIELLLFQNNYYNYHNEYQRTPFNSFSNGIGGEIDFIIKEYFSINIMFGGSFSQDFQNTGILIGLGFHYKL